MKIKRHIFEQFTDDAQTIRPLHQVVEKAGYVIATNAHILIRASIENVDFKAEEPVESYPEAAFTLIDEYKEKMKNIQGHQISVSEFKNTLSKIPKEAINKMIDCTHCSGEGVEMCWNCEQEHNCEHCSGDGVQVTDEVIGERYSNYHDIRIDNQHFKAQVLQPIVDTADAINRDTVKWLNRPNKNYRANPALALMPEVEILVMPVVFNSDRENSLSDEYMHVLSIPETA